MRIAIVGSGISGLTAAHVLRHAHDITVFEAGDHIGGHTHTHRVEVDGVAHEVDTGFIVYNERNYPNFTRLLAELEVATEASDMSFSVRDERTGLEYRGTNLDTLFAQRRNLVSPAFWRMVVDIVRFHRHGRRLLADPDEDLTLRQFLDRHDFSKIFEEDFALPLGASIWSADPSRFDQFPMISLARFYDNHGLLSLGDHPEWRCIAGGSARYVEKLTAPFIDRIRLRCPVEKVVRHGDGAEVVSAAFGSETFDAVILAVHSDQALAMLGDPSPGERRVLGGIAYQPNVATLHTDERLLPRQRRAWASWNYHVLDGGADLATLTYWMNPLQNIESDRPLLVTLNRHDDIDPSRVLGRWEYSHPVFDHAALHAQRDRGLLQGRRRTWYCGAYWGYGFHEDGVRSALDVCRDLGVDW